MAKRHPEIVGAGPSGLAAALTARAADASVTVYEKHLRAGARFHGYFQGLENRTTEEGTLAELARMGLLLAFEQTPVHEIVCFDSRGALHRLNAAARPILYLVKRGTADDSFDTALVRQAMKAGATLRWSTRVDHPARTGMPASDPEQSVVVLSSCARHVANSCARPQTTCVEVRCACHPDSVFECKAACNRPARRHSSVPREDAPGIAPSD